MLHQPLSTKLSQTILLKGAVRFIWYGHFQETLRQGRLQIIFEKMLLVFDAHTALNFFHRKRFFTDR